MVPGRSTSPQSDLIEASPVQPPVTLAFDFGSRVATAAVAAAGRLLAALAEPREGRDADLLPLVERVLAAAGVSRDALTGVVALAGPGSFTGVRVACATALGLGSALGVPAHGLSTLEALARAVPLTARPVVAVVDALRGDWFVQSFDRSTAGLSITSEAVLRPATDGPGAGTWPISWTGALIVGEEAARFIFESGRNDLEPHQPEALAAAAALATSDDGLAGSTRLLHRPLYLRPAAIRRPV